VILRSEYEWGWQLRVKPAKSDLGNIRRALMLRSSSMRTASFVAIVLASAIAACSKKSDAPPAAPAPPPAPVAESAAAPKPESSRIFMIGELTATALRDGYLDIPNDNKVFGLGHTPEEVAAVLSAAGQPTDKLHLDIQPLLVRMIDRMLLFDTGASGNFGPTAGELPASLSAARIDPNSVTDIFISHMHGDHIGGLVNAQGALNFPNATIHISKPEWKFLTELGAEKAKEMGFPNYDAFVAATKPKVDAFAPGSQLIQGTVKAVEIKGHTPGHSGYLITSGPESLLYVGDSMHHFVVSVQKPEWPMVYDQDQATGAKSRAALVADSAARAQRIYAVHFPFPGIGKIEKRAEGFGFVWIAE
jgi:glyoxylase-like metal-dependent hydrolase (beta-lactamase superfamily II)